MPSHSTSAPSRSESGQHPATATGLNNLAELYHDQGRYAEVEQLEPKHFAGMGLIGLGLAAIDGRPLRWLVRRMTAPRR